MNFSDMSARYIRSSGLAVRAAGLLVIVAGFCCGCAEKKHAEMPPRPVRTGAATLADVPVFIDSFGTLASPHVVDVKSRVTGEIKEVFFAEGQSLADGDLLAIVDPRPYKAEVDKAEAALQQALVDLKTKRDTLERNRQLAVKELISSEEFDQHQSAAAAAEAQVALNRATLEYAKLNLEFCSIRSPVEGVAGRRQIDPGNIVSANAGPALVNIRMMNPLYVDFTVSERDLGRLRDAMATGSLEVEIRTDEAGGAAYSGTLKFLENTVDDSTGTIFLRAVVPNEEKRLWPGQFIRVRLTLAVQKDALTAPGPAVQLGKNGYYVFVVLGDNTVELRNVSIGQRHEEYVVIEKGVEAGETVVTLGQMGLAPGSMVRIIPDDSQERAPPQDG